MRRAFILALACLAACATPQTVQPGISADAVEQEAIAQKRFVIEQRLAESQRVDAIHQRLSTANLEFCTQKTKSIGASVYALKQYSDEFHDAAEDIGLTDAPTLEQRGAHPHAR